VIPPNVASGPPQSVEGVVAPSSSSADDIIVMECDKCKLQFDSKKALVVHMEKFCGRLDQILGGSP